MLPVTATLKARGLRYRFKRRNWLAAVSVIHKIFDSRISSIAPLQEFKVLALCVYRYKNAAIVLRCVSEAVRRGWDVRLWALDRVHPDLERFSRGAGAGSRCALLNALITRKELEEFDWTIVMDDDFEVDRGSLASFLAIARVAGLCLAQPAHMFDDYRTYAITRGSRFAVARLTTFVEIGPIFAVNRVWADRILPFPEGFQMGWGLGLIWSDLRREGARLGVVDWVTVNHLAPVGRAYDRPPERERMDKLLQDHGLNAMQEMQETLAVWPPWEPRPPWLEEGTGDRE
jgi:hypothetical protein